MTMHTAHVPIYSSGFRLLSFIPELVYPVPITIHEPTDNAASSEYGQQCQNVQSIRKQLQYKRRSQSRTVLHRHDTVIVLRNRRFAAHQQQLA